MNAAAEVFESHRVRLLGVACRMLGSRGDAEDVIQDAYLRWHQSRREDIESPTAFLITVTTRLCLDRLRRLKVERDQYIGQFVPGLMGDELVASPEMQRELADEVSLALLMILERLGREERAAFLLHEVFDYDYREVAQVLGKAEACCRQLVHRARVRVRESHPRFTVSAESRERVLQKFLAAVRSADRKAVVTLLEEEVEYVSEGGSKVRQTEAAEPAEACRLAPSLRRSLFHRRQEPRDPGDRITRHRRDEPRAGRSDLSLAIDRQRKLGIYNVRDSASSRESSGAIPSRRSPAVTNNARSSSCEHEAGIAAG